LTAPRRIGVPYRVIACHDPECWLPMMGFQLVDDHLAITVPAIACPIRRAVTIPCIGSHVRP
jgi:hypothetical protein